MLNKINFNSSKQIFIVYIVLTVATLAVFWQVKQFDFIVFDDPVYVTENDHIRHEIMPDGLRWAFDTTYAEFWHPLTWISLMFDYQLYGLRAGGYHLTNVILHLLSALLLFWLFNRMTGAIWKSAFVAALFALHPLRVESVAWIAERKDVLSAFFLMLTLCLYVYYTEKPVIRRYLPVLLCFACALMSKPIVVTLPIVMILLDYWPLQRHKSRKSHLVRWQLREKIPFFILSAVVAIITFYAQYRTSVLPFSDLFSLSSRLYNAPVFFMTYLEKTFWPHDLAILYTYLNIMPLWQFLSALFLMIIVSIVIIASVKYLPYLFVGWFWYAITILPVIGIIPVGDPMADRYIYLPSIGIAIMLAWGIPHLIKSEGLRKKVLFPAAITVMAISSFLAWHQCGYWKNSIELFNRALRLTKDNHMAYYGRGAAYDKLGQHQCAIDDYKKAIEINPHYTEAYNNKGVAYIKLNRYQNAIDDFNMAISLKQDYAIAYLNRGIAYTKLGQYLHAVEDLNQAIHLQPSDSHAYQNRGIIYFMQGNIEIGCHDFQKACDLGNCELIKFAGDKGYCR